MKKVKVRKRRVTKPRKMSRYMMEQLERAYRKGFYAGRRAEAMGSYRDW